MPLLLDTARSAPAVNLRGANCLTIGLVNNMPEAARAATERQFLDLIRAATPDIVVCLRLFSTCADDVRNGLAERYRDISTLWDTQLDGLIVTGTEPHAADLEDEPYWPVLAELVDWAGENTGSAIWSCLAAHAAVLRTDGLQRRPLADKLCGVFHSETVVAHPLMAGVASRLLTPHSRYNDLPGDALASSGYRLLSRSAVAGVDAFAKEGRGASLFLFFQGHPEYEAGSLLREYRRDVGRFLRGERAQYPAAPVGYLADEAMSLLEAFRTHALAERDARLITAFPMDAIEVGLENTWRRSAVSIYRNWINYLRERRTQRRAATVPIRNARHGPRRAGAAKSIL